HTHCTGTDGGDATHDTSNNPPVGLRRYGDHRGIRDGLCTGIHRHRGTALLQYGTHGVVDAAVALRFGHTQFSGDIIAGVDTHGVGVESHRDDHLTRCEGILLDPVGVLGTQQLLHVIIDVVGAA